MSGCTILPYVLCCHTSTDVKLNIVKQKFAINYLAIHDLFITKTEIL